jgi:peptidoglycan/xylan/chitin deacetylase (PgdA/CDA1 family)
VREDGLHAVVPTSAAAIVACATLRSELPASLLLLSATVGEPCSGLSNWFRNAESAGIRTPRTWLPSGAGGWLEQGSGDLLETGALPFPVVLRVASRIDAAQPCFPGRAYYCASPETLSHTRDTVLRPYRDVFLQEYLPGESEYALLLRQQGELRMHFAYRSEREATRWGGRATSLVCVEDGGPVQDAAKLLAACDYAGLASVEYRRDASGRRCLVGLDRSPWCGAVAALYAGLDFPATWLHFLQVGSQRTPATPSPRGIRRALVSSRFTDEIHSLPPGLTRLCDLRNLLIQRKQFCWSDPAPRVAALVGLVDLKARRVLIPMIHGPGRNRLLAQAARLAERAKSLFVLAAERRHARIRHRQTEDLGGALRSAANILFLELDASGCGRLAAALWNDRLHRAGVLGVYARFAAIEAARGPQNADAWRAAALRAGLDPDQQVAANCADEAAAAADIVFALDRPSYERAVAAARAASVKCVLLDSPACHLLTEVPAAPALNALMAGRRRPVYPLRIFMFHAVIDQPLEVPHYCFVERPLFRRQLELIRRHYRVLPLAEGVRRLRAGELREPTSVITFDDGFENNFTHAFPELQRLELPASIFVATGFTGSQQTVWFCRVLRAVAEARARAFVWNGQRYDVSGVRAKILTATDLMAQLKRQPPDVLEADLACIETLLGCEARRPVEAGSPFRMLGAPAIREMAASGLVDFGGHTVTHAILSRLSIEGQRREIEESLNTLSRILDEPCQLFAYPNGQSGDFDQHSIECLRGSGVSVAMTAMPGVNPWFGGPFELLREGIGPSDLVARFEARIERMVQFDRLHAGAIP